MRSLFIICTMAVTASVAVCQVRATVSKMRSEAVQAKTDPGPSPVPVTVHQISIEMTLKGKEGRQIRVFFEPQSHLFS